MDKERQVESEGQAEAEPTEVGSKRCPINFDMHSAEHAAHHPEIYARLRTTCPRAWTDSYGGFWIASRYKDLMSIAQRSDVMTTAKSVDPVTGAVQGGNTIPSLSPVRFVPNETESPEWESVRRFLNRRFAPRATEERRSRTAQFVTALLDKVIESGEIDLVDDLANPLPALVTMDIFGFPLEEWSRFAEPVHRLTYLMRDQEGHAEALADLGYFRKRVAEEIEKRRSTPTDDLLSHMANGFMDDEPLSDDIIQEIAWQILAGGVDTTTALTANALLYLSRNPEEKRRLSENFDMIPLACEEFVRFFTPIHGTARNVKVDVDIDNWRLEKGDRVLLAYSSANRDPDYFENPEELILDRTPNRHIGFGAGMHRCMGTSLARLMFQEMMEGVFKRIPDYSVNEDAIKQYPSIGGANGWIHLPAKFSPGARLGQEDFPF